jgi:predicted metal-dependent HD superfamily phosphohydrolase
MIDKYILLVKPYYDEPHRKFHNWDHIEYGLNVFKKLDIGTTEQKIAWLFHDIVYDPTRKDNELLSAEIAKKSIIENGDEDKISVDNVSIIINDTANHTPSNSISSLVLDIDMSSLADNNYNEFERQRILAAQEYAFYGKDAVIAGTRSFIMQTLNQERIFTTDTFQAMEPIARSNLKKYLESLDNNKKLNDLFNTSRRNTFKL